MVHLGKKDVIPWTSNESSWTYLGEAICWQWMMQMRLNVRGNLKWITPLSPWRLCVRACVGARPCAYVPRLAASRLHRTKLGVTLSLLCLKLLTVFNFTSYRAGLCLSVSLCTVEATPGDKLCQALGWFIKFWFLWRTLMSRGWEERGGWTGVCRSGGGWCGGENMSQVSLPAPGTVLSPLPALLGIERQEKREK